MTDLCGGCGVDTDALGEYYMVKDELWEQAWPGSTGSSDLLCIGCLEERLGRKLTPADFADCGLNHKQRIFARSARLRDRLSAGATTRISRSRSGPERANGSKIPDGRCGFRESTW
jgi:hypothetical protein